MSLLVRLGNYISTKPNFIKASIWMFGVPFGVVMAILTHEYNPWLPVFSLLLAPLAGYLWGLAMWHLHFQSVYARRARHAAVQDTGK
jgi:hypothetical protein